MDIRCTCSKRYLFKIEIEKYYENLKKMGIDITTPITIEYPCQKCKLIEVYEIYPIHYKDIKSYKRNNWQINNCMVQFNYNIRSAKKCVANTKEHISGMVYVFLFI